jgi:hypothetical protein
MKSNASVVVEAFGNIMMELRFTPLLYWCWLLAIDRLSRKVQVRGKRESFRLSEESNKVLSIES